MKRLIKGTLSSMTPQAEAKKLLLVEKGLVSHISSQQQQKSRLKHLETFLKIK